MSNAATKGKKYGFQDTKAKKAWNFFWLNAIGVVGMLALFYAILYGDFLTGAFTSAWVWLSDHEVIMALAASTPFFAAMLVGRASSAKAKRKRMAEAKRVADAEAKRARDEREARRASQHSA